MPFLVAACGGEEERLGAQRSVPAVPAYGAGQSTLSGRVLSLSGQPVSGAELLVTETGLRGNSDEAGRFSLAVPADSTLSVRVSAAGFATTQLESVQIKPDKTAELEAVLAPPAKIAEFSALAQRPAEGQYGAMAIVVRSISGKCSPDGARITVAPPGAAKVFYAKPGAASAEIDPALTAIGRTDGVVAWLGGVIPPGGDYVVRLEKAGCDAVAPAISHAEMSYSRECKVKVDAAGVAQVTLFVE